MIYLTLSAAATELVYLNVFDHEVTSVDDISVKKNMHAG